MPCPQCAELEQRLLQANIDYVNANSELLDVARRPYDTTTDEQRYADITSKLASARVAVESVQREFVEHKIAMHSDQVQRVAAKPSQYPD
jgi:hypothetical protein